ncbi:MAG: hypothetical protein GY934_20280, partial [Gammaproteobacteria bacterium]|nr:hypothetical protein [Gammaproteobacteria bacterium]
MLNLSATWGFTSTATAPGPAESQLLLRRIGRLDHGTLIIAHHKDREPGDAVDVIRAQAGVVELTTQVGIA